MDKWPKAIVEKGEKILNQLDFTEDITPQKHDVLNFLQINPETIKVVILGQDPYPTKGIANGFAFAVNSYAPIPQSLKNIFSEIKLVFGRVIADRTLKHWINQGVLLLNTSLTTIISKPNSHKHLWARFTSEIIAWLDQNFDLIWVLWGNEAKKFEHLIKNKIIYDAHPSPLSVQYRKKNSFRELKELVDITW